MTSDEPVRLVQDSQALKTVIETIQVEDCIALDTEFHAERRYFPELMLVQIGVRDGRSWVIDPQSVDISPLFRALVDSELLVHSGEQDLAILLREVNEAALQVFDVQIAAGLCGQGHPTRLDKLVVENLNTQIDKGSTLSDWSKRPLTPAQIAYAASDVRVLFPLRDALTRQLEAKGRLEWAHEESCTMAKRVAEGPQARHIWTTWDIVSRLDSTTQNILGVLFHWRDQQGRKKNQPPFFILSDGLCLDVARRKPKTVAVLSENRRIPQGLIRRLGTDLVEVIKWACDNQADLPLIPTRDEQRQTQLLALWNSAQSAATGIAPSLLLPPSLALEVAHTGIQALTGWRKETIASPLQEFMDGQKGLYFDASGPVIR